MECLQPIKYYFLRLWEKIVQKVKYVRRKYFTNKPMAEKTVEITEMKKDDKLDKMEKGLENNIKKELVMDIGEKIEEIVQKNEDKKTIINRKSRKRKRRNSSDKISDKWETIDLPNMEDKEVKDNKENDLIENDKTSKSCLIS
jgi:hypothetical protein